MKAIPSEISGARVLCFAVLGSNHRQIGGTKHYVGGDLRTRFSGLVIAEYPGDDGYYLFYCDEDWNAVTDTHHESVERAKNQAEFEFEGSRDTWQVPRPKPSRHA